MEHIKRGKGSYECPECGLVYNTKESAKKCEAWCRKNNSCNLEIAKNAINKDNINSK